MRSGQPSWMAAEIDLLRTEYAKEIVDLKTLEKKLGRLRSNICRKAKSLGLPTTMHRKHSAERRAAQSRAFGEGYWKNGHPRGMAGKSHTENFKKLASIRIRAMWADPKSKVNTPEHRQVLSDRATKMQKNGGRRTRYSRCRAGKRADLGGLYVRSSWEANYARYLNWLLGRGEIKEWHYEKVGFDFPVKRGTRFYTPDFQVIENDGSVVYHEVKGWMTQKGQTALNRMRIHYPGVKIILIARKEYAALAKWRGLIRGWE